MVKRLPVMHEIWVQSLDRENPLEKEMATHSSTLAWKIPWTEEPGRLQSMGSQSRTRLSDFTFTLFSIAAVLVCIPTNSVRGFPFSTPSPAFIACRLLDRSHSYWSEMVPHCGFDLHFSDNE